MAKNALRIKGVAARRTPGQIRRKGGERDENQGQNDLERARQTAGSEVLDDDAGCRTWQAVSQVKEVKEPIVASSATKRFEFFIQWHLTERCNLRCRHCYQGPRQPKEMNPDEVKKEIDGVTETIQAWEEEHDISVSPSIHFTGGEPFLYKGLQEVIRHARKKGYGVALMTNASLIKRGDADSAFQLGVFDIQVSLEGPQTLHDMIRGKKTFFSAVRGVERLLGAGNRVSANVTLSRVNADHIEETAAIAREMGFYGIGFSRVVPCGSGKAMMDQLLSPDELRRTYQKVISLNSPTFQSVSGDPLAGILTEFPPTNTPLTLSGCSAGFSGVTIGCDGSVMPCRRIGLTIGNLRKKSLRSLWASSRLLWQLRRKESYLGRCGRCPRWASCRGCRAVAYAYSVAQSRPDVFADDPQCWLNRDPHLNGTT